MKRVFVLFFVGIIGCGNTFGQQEDCTAERISLNDGWQFAQTGTQKWYDAEVPGSVQRDLVRHRVLPDPYFGTNEEKLQWVEQQN